VRPARVGRADTLDKALATLVNLTAVPDAAALAVSQHKQVVTIDAFSCLNGLHFLFLSSCLRSARSYATAPLALRVRSGKTMQEFCQSALLASIDSSVSPFLSARSLVVLLRSSDEEVGCRDALAEQLLLVSALLRLSRSCFGLVYTV